MVIAEVVVVIVELVLVVGRQVRRCRSLFKSTVKCMGDEVLPG